MQVSSERLVLLEVMMQFDDVIKHVLIHVNIFRISSEREKPQHLMVLNQATKNYISAATHLNF